MQRTQFGAMACSIARTLDVIGEPWSPLILRDVYAGTHRFEQLQRGLGVSRKVLAERLNWLVTQGVLTRREYSTRPVRHEYLLTDKGMELCDLLLVMVRWGDRWTAGEAARRCSTATTPAAGPARWNCGARRADNPCTPRTSTYYPAPAQTRATKMDYPTETNAGSPDERLSPRGHAGSRPSFVTRSTIDRPQRSSHRKRCPHINAR